MPERQDQIAKRANKLDELIELVLVLLLLDVILVRVEFVVVQGSLKMQHRDKMDVRLVERDKPRVEDLRNLGVDDLLLLIIDWT